MSDNVASIDDISESEEIAPPAPTPPRRGPGHRGQDVRDTMAEMAAKAHEISLEAGSKMAGTMREVIGAAAGLTAFAIESARDLVQYMVRRGQMTQDEADKLMREVEAAHASLPKVAPKSEPSKAESAPKKAQSPTAAPVLVSPSALVPPPTMAASVPEPVPVSVVQHPAPPKIVQAPIEKPAMATIAPKAVVEAPKTATKVALPPTAASPTKSTAPAKLVSKPILKPQSKSAAKTIAKPHAKVSLKPAVKASVKPAVKAPVKPTLRASHKAAAKKSVPPKKK